MGIGLYLLGFRFYMFRARRAVSEDPVQNLVECSRSLFAVRIHRNDRRTIHSSPDEPLDPSKDRAEVRRFPADYPHRSDCHSPRTDPKSRALSGRVPPDTRTFQHIAKFYYGHLVNSTVIVTAAVYRGLGSELRPEGLTPPRNLPAPGRRHSVYIVLGLRTLLCFY
jgi:hypothetical protein